MLLSLKNEQIPCRVEKTSGRKMNMKFHPSESVLIIRTPTGKYDHQVKQFIEQNETWIVQQYQKLKGLYGQKDQFWENIKQGVLPYMGRPHKLVFQVGKQRWIKKEGESLIISVKPGEEAPQHQQSILFNSLKALATSYLKRRTHELAVKTNSDYNTVRVKNHRSKWGSCSNLRNINLNWLLIFLDESLIDYVIIHELMHLREMNHSPRYWKWVETYYPNYQKARAEVKKNQWLIGIFDN